jgi:hypothetical protein
MAHLNDEERQGLIKALRTLAGTLNNCRSAMKVLAGNSELEVEAAELSGAARKMKAATARLLQGAQILDALVGAVIAGIATSEQVENGSATTSE